MAAQKTGPALGSTGLLTDVDTVQRNRLGLVVPGTDAVGNYAEYIYLTGVASTAIGSWVTYDELLLTTLTLANALGPVAVAMSACVASSYGWYCIRGSVNGLCLANYADNAKVWVTSTAGQVDDADVAVDLVINAVGRSARVAATGFALFQIHYPFCLNEVYN